VPDYDRPVVGVAGSNPAECVEVSHVSVVCCGVTGVCVGSIPCQRVIPSVCVCVCMRAFACLCVCVSKSVIKCNSNPLQLLSTGRRRHT
jgi:hypothetical protein